MASGCLGRLLMLPRYLLGGSRTAAPRQLPAPRGLSEAEDRALTQARQAAARVKETLHGAGRMIDPDVLDQIGGGVDALLQQVEGLATQLTEARAWAARHDAEALQRELVALEMEEGPGFAARQAAIRALRDKGRVLRTVSAEMPSLSAKLRAAGGRVETLEAELRLDTLRQDAAASAERVRELERQTASELAAWSQTVAEMRALS